MQTIIATNEANGAGAPSAAITWPTTPAATSTVQRTVNHHFRW